MLGQNFIIEDPSIHTNIRTHVYDSDEVSAYPTATSVANVSKGTTKRELAKIEGIEEALFRKQNLNLVIGATNSLEYVENMFSFARPKDLLAMFKSDLQQGLVL